MLFCKDKTSLWDKFNTLSSAYNVTSKLEHSVKSLIGNTLAIANFCIVVILNREQAKETGFDLSVILKKNVETEAGKLIITARFCVYRTRLNIVVKA